MPGFVGVHIGAGCHGKNNESNYMSLCRKACRQGVEALLSGENAVEAACKATLALEDSPLTNAGLGSNLTLDGGVECDASVMCGHSLQHGAVGAVAGVKNPVLLAKSLCQVQDVPLSFSRVPPCFLVGPGAYKWAITKGIQTIAPSEMITEKAYKQFTLLKKRIFAEEQEIKDVKPYENHLDTVGAVCIDLEGRVASACSSGGILLKHPGRVGQAGVYGCGVWAENTRLAGEHSVAVTVSGGGEDLIKTCIARDTALALKTSECPTMTVNQSIRNIFLDSPYLSGTSQKLCGLIGLVEFTGGGGGEFLWGHTTVSMGVGYMSTDQRKAKSQMSRMSDGALKGRSVVIQGTNW